MSGRIRVEEEASFPVHSAKKLLDFFRRSVVRNQFAMVQYTSTITEQLPTTPRRKNLGIFSVVCFSQCGSWERRKGFLQARMFQHRRNCPFGRQILYRPSLAKVAVCA